MNHKFALIMAVCFKNQKSQTTDEDSACTVYYREIPKLL